jgi:hypothetical protein
MPDLPTHRSRAELLLLSAQLLLTLGGALAIAQGWTEAGAGGWATLLPLACTLPSAAAFRRLRAGAWGLAVSCLLSCAALSWTGGGPMAVAAACWPLLSAALLLLAAVAVRADRERESARIHRHTRANLSELEQSESCGCIACQAIYLPGEIARWREDGTALCPRCGEDAVVGSASGIPIAPGVLRRAHLRRFLADDRALVE